MSEKYQVIMDFIKDISFEIPTADAYVSSVYDIEKYETKIDIKNSPLANGLNELNLKISLEAPKNIKNKIHTEFCIAVIFKILDPKEEQDKIKKIILADIPNIYSKKIIEIFNTIFQQSGFNDFKFKKNIDFEEMYENQKKISLSN